MIGLLLPSTYLHDISHPLVDFILGMTDWTGRDLPNLPRYLTTTKLTEPPSGPWHPVVRNSSRRRNNSLPSPPALPYKSPLLSQDLEKFDSDASRNQPLNLDTDQLIIAVSFALHFINNWINRDL